jgi:hypothetical protein
MTSVVLPSANVPVLQDVAGAVKRRMLLIDIWIALCSYSCLTRQLLVLSLSLLCCIPATPGCPAGCVGCGEAPSTVPSALRM